MPVRKIPISSRSLTGRHAYGRGKGAVGFESSLERDFISLMRFDANVTDIEEQPVRISFQDTAGKHRHYTPDFLVHRRSGASMLAEIKPAKFVTADLDDKFNAARNFARRRGWTFEVWTEREIRIPRLENAKFLLPYQQAEPPTWARDRLLIALGETGRTTVTRLLEATCRQEDDRAEALFALWHLVATGTVAAGMDDPLTPATNIHLNEGDQR
ncbi:TnsA endonuclease N-terminal domain-containing protein [Thalassospiraceae bacterium LMO-SO8]|nr:TnsA endonuclease N-terminal domain-containing protein [Alphaproteobacteria bacterium LMO-S08]WND77058.1 TnsA endonuclease N-terminal domain-containing protein [Thalassospiraceae bacterium LMO-SO8]|tara:strand:- start:3388 stop:4029 length:642 start_codon:yes stop_codon:yes gene_type:complete